MTLRLIIPPAVEPVSLADAKLHCRVDHNADDELISDHIATARRQAEHQLGRALITQTWERVLDQFPAAEIELGMPPVRQVLAVRYLDAAGVMQTVPAASYLLDDVRTSGWVLPVSGTSWPAVETSAGAVRVTFTCGMADDAAALRSIAPEVRQWILLQVGALYDNRAAISQGRPAAALPDGYADRLLDRLRTY